MRRTQRWWERLTLTIPLAPGSDRFAYVLTPEDGLTVEEARRVANIILAWAGDPDCVTDSDE